MFVIIQHHRMMISSAADAMPTRSMGDSDVSREYNEGAG
jgi:hypothetical protein